MKLSWAKYALLASIFLASTGLAWALQRNGVWQELAAAPAVLALIGAVYQLVRDEAAHLKSLVVQHDQQRFDLGATSHMADIAFDKHVAFCEEYIAALHLTVDALARHGTSEHALEEARKLREIQLKHSLWITSEMEQRLDAFHLALRKIGASAHLYNQDPRAAITREKVPEMFNLFSDIMGWQRDTGEPGDREIAATTIIERAREALGVRKLIDLRQRLLELKQFPAATD